VPSCQRGTPWGPAVPECRAALRPPAEFDRIRPVRALAHALLCADLDMIQTRTTRGKTWMTVALFAVGAHGGVMAHALLDPDEERCELVDVASAPTSGPRDAVRCVDGDAPAIDRACVIDLAALEAEHMPFPRGLRLLPTRGGLRLDGARGLTTRLGLRSGDVLLAIDDHFLRDGQDLEVLRDAVERGGFTLRFRRAHRERGLRITIVDREN
jgi:hypothetical protein